MLGHPKPRRLDEPIAVSLERLVPADHFYRHLEAKFDLSFVRDWTRDLYAQRGRPSIDPVVFFKLQLVMFFEGIRSERKLVETDSLNLAHRWYLGYALDEKLPDHSSLTRIRQRLGLATFELFFETIVDLCQAVGLIWGRELYVDATKVEANADVDSLVPRFYQDAKTHVADLFAADPAPDEQDNDAADPPPQDDVASPEGLVHLPPRVLSTAAAAAPEPTPRWKLLEERRLDPNRPAVGSYRRTTDFRVSRTDPDATPMRTGSGTVLGYHDHYVVDGGTGRIILAALVTPADVMENVLLQDLLWRVCFRRKLWPHQVTGDTTYGTVENIVALEDAVFGRSSHCRISTGGRPSSARARSRMTSRRTHTAARRDSPCHAARPNTPRKRSSIGPTPRPATPAPSKPPAPPATAAASSTAPSTRPTSTTCAATTPPRSTRRQCANERSGSSRSLPRRRPGMACGGSGCAAWRRRTCRDSSLPLART